MYFKVLLYRMNRILPSLIRPRTLLVIGEGIPVADYHEDEITREPAGESVKNAIYDTNYIQKGETVMDQNIYCQRLILDFSN